MSIEALTALTKQRMVAGKRWIAPRGNPEARLMIVTHQPSIDDVQAGVALSKDTAEVLNQVLQAVGIPAEACWFTSIFKGSTTKKITNTQLKEHFELYFKPELEMVKPDLIITLGADAFKSMFGPSKSTEWQGMVIDGKYGKMLATHNPYLVGVIDPLLRKEFVQHFNTAGRYLSGHTYDSYTYEVVTDPKRNTEILQAYLDKGLRRVGFDGEWVPAIWNENEVLTDLSYAFEDNHSIILNLAPDLITENRELLDTMKLALERPDIEITGWNAKVDLKRLMHRGFKFHDESLHFDGMIATPMIDSRHGKGLDVGVYNYTNLPPYWVELYEELKKNKLPREKMAHMKLLNPDVWWRYCAGDGVAHFQTNNAMEKAMNERCQPAVIKYYKEVYLQVMWYIIDMEMGGLPVDVEAMERMTVLYDAAYDVIRKQLLSYTTQLGIEDYNPHAWQSKNKLFFEKFGLNPGVYTKKTKAKSRFWYAKATDKQVTGYNPSSNAKSLAIMYQDLKQAIAEKPDDAELAFQLKVLKTQIDLDKLNPFANKFLNKQGTKFEDDGVVDEVEGEEAISLVVDEDEVSDALKCSYWNATGKDNRIYMDVFPILDNFRWSTRPNTQVLPSKTLSAMKGIFKEVEPALKEKLPGLEKYTPDNIRNILWSGDKDWLFVEADCLAADLGHLGYLAKDPVLLAAVREKSFHVEMAKVYFDNPAITKDANPELIVTSKAYSFGSTYSSHFGSAAAAIQGMLYGETGTLKTVEEIEEALTKGWGQYARYMVYKKECEENVREKFYIENGYGMRLTFEPTDDYGVLARYINRALAWCPASSMATHMSHVGSNLRKYFSYAKEWGKWIKPINACHDAFSFTAHKDMLKDNYLQDVIAAMFSKVTPISTGDYVGVDMEISDRWKGTTVWAGKTKWLNNEWVLKQTSGH